MDVITNEYLIPVKKAKFLTVMVMWGAEHQGWAEFLSLASRMVAILDEPCSWRTRMSWSSSPELSKKIFSGWLLVNFWIRPNVSAQSCINWPPYLLELLSRCFGLLPVQPHISLAVNIGKELGFHRYDPFPSEKIRNLMESGAGQERLSFPYANHGFAGKWGMCDSELPLLAQATEADGGREY